MASEEKIRVHFTDISSRICEYIHRSDGVDVCSAWFTDPQIIQALEIKTCRVVIGYPYSINYGHPEYRPSLKQDLIDSIGYKNIFTCYKKEGMIHNKFMVFYKETTPYAVLTGSYNLTLSAKLNDENVIYVEDSNVAKQYVDEFERILKTCVRIDL